MKSFPLFARAALALVVLLAGASLLPAGPARGADFADSAFLRTWLRIDAPVAARQASRSWYWGPLPICSTREAYKEAPDGSGVRLVQYFDKSRMELNNPSGDPNDPFYVTNGLLAYELIAGLVQTGNSRYEVRTPADVVVAGDIDDASAPTYRSFGAVTSTPAGTHVSPSMPGQPVIATIDRAGTVGNDRAKLYYPGTAIAHYDDKTQHNIPAVFWDFINASGPVLAGGKLVPGKLSDPPAFVAGLPISEAYWARVRVAGQPTDVLIQAFQRRMLTYIPALAPPWNVQMGNIGAHYLLWRYGMAGCGATSPPAVTATPVPPTATPVPPPAPRVDAVPLFRLYKPKTSEHFYTIDPSERGDLVEHGYNFEGTEGRVWNGAIPDTVPLYRLYNRLKDQASRHLLTVSPVERDFWLKAGWTLELDPHGGPGGGYVYLAPAPQTVPLTRWYSPRADDHLYTISPNPAVMERSGYRSEGIACYVITP